MNEYVSLQAQITSQTAELEMTVNSLTDARQQTINLQSTVDRTAAENYLQVQRGNRLEEQLHDERLKVRQLEDRIKTMEPARQNGVDKVDCCCLLVVIFTFHAGF